MAKTKQLRLRQVQNDKSYEELCKEAKEDLKELINSTAANWIPKFCEALRRESKNPEKPTKEDIVKIRARIIKDWSKQSKKDNPWTESTIRTYWADFMKNPKNVAAGVIAGAASAAARRQEAEISRNNSIYSEQEQKDREWEEKDEEQAPVESYTTDEWEEKHPTIERSPFQLIGDINRAIARLWTTLTNNPNMPHMEDNVKKDLIIPTRPFFKDIVNGSSKVERDFLFNWLTWLNMCVADRIDIVEKADKTAYDTRTD